MVIGTGSNPMSKKPKGVKKPKSAKKPRLGKASEKKPETKLERMIKGKM